MAESPEILLLGELSVVRGGRPISLPASKKTRALLGYLAISGRSHTREELCDLLWQGPDDPRAALRWSLTKLRSVLGADALEADRERIGLVKLATDLAAVRDAVRGGIERTTTERLTAAAARFRGELLEGLTLPDCYRFHEWSTGERDSARTTRIAILAALVERSASDPEQALRWARERVAIDPLSEASHVAVIRMLAGLGRKRDAIAQYETCCRILEHELNTRPTSVLLEAKMLIGAAPKPIPAPAEAPPSRSPEAPSRLSRFVGRARELDLVKQTIDAAAGGQAERALIFLGEPGIGKTRLLDEAANRTRDKGGLVLRGRAFESEMVRVYGPWIDALRSVPLAEVPESSKHELGALLPELGESQAAANRAGLFEAVVRLLTHLSRATPVAILLDDLQWCDEATTALIHYAERALRGTRIAFAVAARAGELSDNPHALKLVRGLVRDGHATLVELGPLDADAVLTLARELAPDADVERLIRQSAGNPLFALELARAVERGDDALWNSLGGLISHRLARLDERARELLAWAAAFGTSFELGLLERVTGIAPLELDGRIAELERRALVRVSNDGNGYDFVHDLVRDGAYRQLSEPRRRGVHRAIARALESLDGPESEHASETAHHAALGGEHGLAARSALAAAERALRMFAGTEAARLAETGLQQVASLPQSERLKLELGLFTVLVYARRWSRHVERVQSELSRAVAEAQAVGLHAEATRGLHTLSVLQYDGGDFVGAHETSLRAADAGREADPVTLATQLGDSARCLAMLERDMDQAHAMYAEARVLAEQTGAELMLVDWAGGLLAAFAGERSGAIPFFESVLASARRIQDRWIEYECLRQLVQLEIESPGSASHDYSAELIAVAEKLGEGSAVPGARALDALVRRRRGEAANEQAVEDAIDTLRVVDAKGMLAYMLTESAASDLDAGQFERAERRANEALKAAEIVNRRSQMALARVILARLALARGDSERARRLAEATEPDYRSSRVLSARARAAFESLRAVVT